MKALESIWEISVEAIISTEERQKSNDEKELEDYVHMTRVVTLAGALLLGLMVSSVGIRVLEPIVTSS